jgi:hypothetical protein
MHGKDTLDANAVRHLPNRKGSLAALPPPTKDDSLKDLDAFLVAFLDLGVDPDRVSGAEIRQVGLQVFPLNLSQDIHKNLPFREVAVGSMGF